MHSLGLLLSCSSLAAHRTTWAGRRRRFERSFSIRRHITNNERIRRALWFVYQLDFMASTETGNIAQQLLKPPLHRRSSFTRNQCGDTIPATIGACESNGKQTSQQVLRKQRRWGWEGAYRGWQPEDGSSMRCAPASSPHLRRTAPARPRTHRPRAASRRCRSGLRWRTSAQSTFSRRRARPRSSGGTQEACL